MDFSLVSLTAEERDFQSQAREFLTTHVTAELLATEQRTGDGFIEELHLAMGEAGWLEPETKSADEGGFTPVQRRIWDLERRRARLPLETWGGTMMILQAVRRHAAPDLLAEILPKVYRGQVRFAMGYTEPEGGSDIATCKTRAEKVDDMWVINGQKMFTSGAHNCQYIFLLTNTDPHGRRHHNLTMFLVPVDTPGIAIQGLRTVDGERSNITFYNDVVVADRYRLGDVNDGWAVLSGPLAAEHGAGRTRSDGLSDVAIMSSFGTTMAETADRVSLLADRNDGATRYRLGRAHARIEAALSAPGLFGRVAIAQTMRDLAPELMDVLGSGAALTGGAPTTTVDSGAEYLYRWAPLIGIYGGTIDVFRNMIAQHILGLGKPSYAKRESRR